MQNWEEDDRQGPVPRRRRSQGCARGLRAARHSACTCATSRPSTGMRCSRISSTNTAPAARRIPTCSATARSSSGRSSTTRARSAPNTDRDRALRAHRLRRWPLAAAARARRGEGSELFPARAASGSAVGDAVSGRRAGQGRRARDRARGDASDPREEGFDRHLLHRRARFPRVPRPTTSRRRRGEIQHAAKAPRSASTPASSTTRSASAAALASAGARMRAAIRGTSSARISRGTC